MQQFYQSQGHFIKDQPQNPTHPLTGQTLAEAIQEGLDSAVVYRDKLLTIKQMLNLSFKVTNDYER